MVNVAVITPFYNTQEYLRRCILSVLGQKNVSIEFFLIDDGSEDSSSSIAQFYQRKDPRVTYIRTSNKGQGAARNIGIKLSNAEFVYFVDSDDYLGENCLSKLYNMAKDNSLDICSPKILDEYFDKPLEFISCLPCKAQFIRLDLIRNFELFQPSISSGQDGVFSHLVLTHCKRIGMAKDAVFHYTHARDGSTFKAHLQMHDAQVGLIGQHLDCIRQHYDKYDLWNKNGIRVLEFIVEESIKNRLKPHFRKMSDSDRLKACAMLAQYAKRAYEHVPSEYRPYLHPIIKDLLSLDVKKFSEKFLAEFLSMDFKRSFGLLKNINDKTKVISKIADKSFDPVNDKFLSDPKKMVDIGSLKDPNSSGVFLNEPLYFNKSLSMLDGKIDLVLNTINNSTVKLLSESRIRAKNLELGNPEILVSLTTTVNRLPFVHTAIESIFIQTEMPGKVILWIDENIDEEYIFTPELKSLMERGLEIRRVKDIGPHTKLIYALESYSSLKIVTVDDDCIYPSNMIACLWAEHKKHPKAIIANWARELTFDSKGVVKNVRSGALLSTPLLEREIEQKLSYSSKPTILAFPYGTGGVLYPPGCLSKKVFEIDMFKKLCPTEDDIWFKAMSVLNRTPVVVTNLGINPVHYSVIGTQVQALRHINHGKNKNHDQMKAVFEYLGLYQIIDSFKK